jgi:hypothetical protein
MLKVQSKPLRIFLRVLLGFLILVILLFAGLSIYVESNKAELLNKLRKGINENLRGDIQYQKADITIWKNFPFIGLRLYNVNLEDSVYHMPLFKMKEVQLEVSLLQLIRKNTELRNLKLSDGVIHVFTDTTGYTNKYMAQLKQKKDTSIKRSIILNHATLRNVQLILENRQRNKLFDFVFKSLDADISVKNNVFEVELDNDAFINSMAFSLEKGSYLKAQPIRMNIDLVYDLNTATLTFDEQTFELNDHDYAMKGKFMLRGDGYFDLDIKTKQAPYQKLTNLFSNNIGSKLGKINIEKPLDVQAHLNGPLGYKTVPKVFASWTVKNNTLTTEVAKFNNCNFSGSFSNEKIKGLGLTNENSEIILKQFSGNWDGIALSGKNISVSNLIDPYFNFSLSSTTTLQVLDKKIGLKTIDLLSGSASLNLSYAGPLITDISILDKLNGKLQFQNAQIRYIPRDFTFTNCSGNVLFSNNSVDVKDLRCELGRTQFIINVEGNNLSGLSANDVSKASITANLYVPFLDVSQLAGLFKAKKSVAVAKAKSRQLIKTASGIDNIMDHGALAVNIKAAKVQYNKFSGDNLNGNIVFSNENMYLKNVSVAHANGKLDITGNILQTGSSNVATAKVNLQNVDVKKIFAAFDDFGQDGIHSNNLQGSLKAVTNLSLMFDAAGKMLPGSMKGTVDFSLKNGALVNYEPIMEIRKSIFKNKDMSHVTFAELKNRLEVDGFKIKINRMEIQSSAIGMFVEGLYDIKKTDTKINIQVPLKNLKRDSTYIPKNIGLDKKAGTSVYLEGKVDSKTGKVKFGLNTTKTLRKLI